MRHPRLRGVNQQIVLTADQVRRIKESPLTSRILARIYRINDRRIKEIRGRP